MTTALKLEGVRTSYSSIEIGPITQSVPPGVTVLLGPSGSGKSTLLSLIAGFELPNAGSIELAGRRIDQRPPESRNVGMVFQDYALFPHLDVGANIAFGASDRSAIETTCALLEIEDLLDRSPSTLSGGEKQRVALARALVSDPDVLLLDEPLASLDAPIRRRLRLELREVLADLAVPVIYVTHDQDEAAVVGDRLAVMFDGSILQEGTVEDVFAAPATPCVAEFLGMETIGTGTVRTSGTDRTVIDIEGETLTASDTVAADRATVMVPPGSIELRSSDSGATNLIECRVERVVPQHTDRVVVLSCDGLGRLTATTSHHTDFELSTGDECVAVIPPEHLRLLTTNDAPSANSDQNERIRATTADSMTANGAGDGRR